MFNIAGQWNRRIGQITQPRAFVIGAMLMFVLTASAQTDSQSVGFSIQGCPGQANVVRLQGRVLVDVQDLARITEGSLRFEKDRITLSPAACETSQAAVEDMGKPTFSRGFMKSAIEAMASIREWGGVLQVIVQNGYPVEKNSAGNSIAAYQDRAADKVALASTAASSTSDYLGLKLLRNEFNNVQAWSDAFVQARSSMSAVNLSMSEDPLNEDEEAGKIVECGQFLAQMFAAGAFEDNAACH